MDVLEKDEKKQEVRYTPVLVPLLHEYISQNMCFHLSTTFRYKRCPICNSCISYSFNKIHIFSLNNTFNRLF